MDYSKTVNLPKTDFSMKANLANKEPERLKEWEKNNIYNQILKARQGKDSFILHDGPPYANGNIHIGHALNKILKDIIIKHKTMKGFKTPYVPGWDCHGLPIELNVTKKLGSKAKEMDPLTIRSECRKYAQKYIDLQREEFKRLGVFGDYSHPYLTMSKDYEAKIIETFGKIFAKGFISRQKKPIYWCPTCATALAEAEVEYDDHSSPSIYVKFKIDPKSFDLPELDSKDSYAIIWTTTPWTLPANLGVCFHPQFKYSFFKFKNDFYLLADDLLANLEKILGETSQEKISFPNEKIKNLKVYHPFIDRESKILFARHVTLEQGTGIVHTAPGHGLEDYIVGLEYDLDPYCPVNQYGCFTKDYSEMEGVNVFKANPLVVDLLKNKKALLSVQEIEHSYPHCWRCKRPLIFRATEQWFLKIDFNNLRAEGLKSINETNWIPAWGETRIKSMAENRPDWCLSRQRIWGVPIPSFRCQRCETNLMSAETIDFFAKLAREEGIDAWYSKSLKELIPLGLKCKCGSTDFIKESDILDVWFDSGVSHFVVLDEREDHHWPADLYLEGSDQHRGWFQSSLWPALALRQKAPFKSVLTHGFVLDEKGKAMSKSQGNVIPPDKIIKQYGADILRLWVSSEDYRNDLRIGMDMIKQNVDSYRKIRNTFKFILGNLADFIEKEAISYQNLTDIDKWILHQLDKLSKEVIGHYDNYEFHLVYKKIVNFCAIELSSIYFDISKDILYVEKKDSAQRRGAQTVLNEVYKSMVKLIAPILVFTSEEIWQFKVELSSSPENNFNKTSIHLEEYYQIPKEFFNPDIEKKLDQIVNLKKDILKALEKKRKEKIINSSLEAEVKLYLKNQNLGSILEEMRAELKRFFQVTKIELCSEKPTESEEYDYSWLVVSKTNGKKCIRCWNYYEKETSPKEDDDLCDRCKNIIKDISL